MTFTVVTDIICKYYMVRSVSKDPITSTQLSILHQQMH